MSEAGLRRALTDFLAEAGPKIADQIVPKYRARFRKDDDPESEDIDGWLAQVMGALDFEGWVSMVPEIAGYLRDAAAVSGKKTLTQLGINAGADPFRIVNQWAVDFANDRAAELVGMKWIEGEVVPNPDPRWAITEGTRTLLRAQIKQAIEDGASSGELREQIVTNYAFSPARALNIARTEVARAEAQGSLKAAKESGVVRLKTWLTAGDHTQDEEDECDDAAAMGPIAIDETFGEAGDAPPAHPSCRCVLSYSTEEGPQAAEG